MGYFSPHCDIKSQVLNVVASAAVCLAWIEVIFMIGRYPFLGGRYVAKILMI